jgi:hypothetical protein
MYFHIDPSTSSSAVTVSNDIFDRQFDLKQWTHRAHIEKFEEAMKQNKHWLADFAASVGVGLTASGYMEPQYFIGKQMDCCRDIVLNYGYQEMTSTDVNKKISRANGDLVILVVGCQEETMLQRRVNRLVDFALEMYSVGQSFKVVFSGRCPKAESVRIPNEAVRMVNMFRRKIEETGNILEPAIPILQLEEEGESSDTKENVKHFISCNHMTSSREVNVVGISSTFHLIRFGRELLVQLREMMASKTPQTKVNNIFLVGAEHMIPNNYVDREYVKLMLYDLYAHRMR